MANVWIFQSNPEKYDITDELNDPNLKEESWNVSRYRHKIKKGDIALHWIADESGKNRGIHAIVEIISEPHLRKVPRSARWVTSDDKDPKEWMVDYRYQAKFTQPLLESEIKKIPGLSELSIIQNHRRINFPVTKTEWDILLKEIKKRGLENNPKRFTVDTINQYATNEKSDIDEGLEIHPLPEGNEIIVDQKIKKRNLKLRKMAIQYHGSRCSVCGFDFYQTYGDRGHGFIEVHHIKPIGTFNEEIDVNPKTDLAPVCANCHRMIHIKPNNVLSIEEMKNILKKI
jgi:5-methylcytosine-specific restriction enzyme A